MLPLNNTACVKCAFDNYTTAISQPNGIVIYNDVLYVVNQNGNTP